MGSIGKNCFMLCSLSRKVGSTAKLYTKMKSVDDDSLHIPPLKYFLTLCILQLHNKFGLLIYFETSAKICEFCFIDMFFKFKTT